MATHVDYHCPRCSGWVEHKNDVCRQCHADPFPDDTMLRKYGFAIESRPKGGPAIWRDTSSELHVDRQRKLTHGEALRRADLRRALPVAVEAN